MKPRTRFEIEGIKKTFELLKELQVLERRDIPYDSTELTKKHGVASSTVTVAKRSCVLISPITEKAAEHVRKTVSIEAQNRALKRENAELKSTYEEKEEAILRNLKEARIKLRKSEKSALAVSTRVENIKKLLENAEVDRKEVESDNRRLEGIIDDLSVNLRDNELALAREGKKVTELTSENYKLLKDSKPWWTKIW